MIGGRNNPLIQATKFRNIRRTHIEKRLEESSTEESANISGGSLATQAVPISTVGPILKEKKIKPTLVKSRVESSTLINNPDLVIIKSLLQEQRLLGLAGLHCEDSDDVHVIKDRSGNICAAMAIKTDSDNIVEEIRYIDVDESGDNFKQGLARLATLPNSLQFKLNEVTIHRDVIREDLIIK